MTTKMMLVNGLDWASDLFADLADRLRPEPVVTVDVTVDVAKLEAPPPRMTLRTFCIDAVKALTTAYPIASEENVSIALFIFERGNDGLDTIGFGTTSEKSLLMKRLSVWLRTTPMSTSTSQPILTSKAPPGARIH